MNKTIPVVLVAAFLAACGSGKAPVVAVTEQPAAQTAAEEEPAPVPVKMLTVSGNEVVLDGKYTSSCFESGTKGQIREFTFAVATFSMKLTTYADSVSAAPFECVTEDSVLSYEFDSLEAKATEAINSWLDPDFGPPAAAPSAQGTGSLSQTESFTPLAGVITAYPSIPSAIGVALTERVIIDDTAAGGSYVIYSVIVAGSGNTGSTVAHNP